MSVPVDEQYETDTIFSQEGELPENYVRSKLAEVESELQNKTRDQYYQLVSDDSDSDDACAFNAGDFTLTDYKTENNSKKNFTVGEFPSTPYVYDDSYDLSQDSFRYGRVTEGVSYQLKTGKMQDEVLQKVKKIDEDKDNVSTTITENKETHVVTTECKISLERGFSYHYDSQMPKFFEYRKKFPQISGIWTILMDQSEYKRTTTFELQVSICAALNSRKFMMMCIGVDEYNSVTGVELTAEQRVIFRMALTRAVAGEFQPPIVKLPPKQLTGISAMKRDVSELTTLVDVLFLPVFGAPEVVEDRPKRFLIVVRVKELSEQLHQLSSGKTYIEEDGQAVELSSLNEAYKLLVLDKDEESKGSLFSENVELFYDSELEAVFEEEMDEYEPPVNSTPSVQDIVNKKILPKIKAEKNKLDRIWELVPHESAENVIWAALGIAVVSYGLYKYTRRT